MFPGRKDGLMESRAAFLSYEDLHSLSDSEKGRGVCAPALHCPPAVLGKQHGTVEDTGRAREH